MANRAETKPADHRLELVDCLESLWHFGCTVDVGSPDDSTTTTTTTATQLQATSTTKSSSSSSSSSSSCSTSARVPLRNSSGQLIRQLAADEGRMQSRRGGPASSALGTDVAATSTSTHRSIAHSDQHPLLPLFRLLDEDEDGRVSLDEMHSLLRKLGKEQVSRACLVSLIESVSPNRDSSSSSRGLNKSLAVDFSQFAALYELLFGAEEERQTQDEDDDELLDAFHVYDRNRDGFISASELAAVLLELGLLTEEEEGGHVGRCQALIDRVDSDGNGLVDLHEFKAMLNTRSCGSPMHQSSTIAYYCTSY